MFKKIGDIIAHKSEFSKNFFILFRGTLIAQLIPLALMPVLTRIYTPEEFGLFELFLSISLILGSVANARYELAVVLPDKKEDVWNLMGLGTIIAVFGSIFFLLVLVFFADFIAELLNNSKIKFWLFLVPPAIFIQGLFNMLSYYNTREKNFNNISNASIVRSSSRTLIQIILGAIQSSPAGLIIGQLFGFAASIIPLLRKLNLKTMLISINWSNMIRVAKRYKDFPKFTMPSTLANSAALNSSSLLISVLFNITSVGFYSLANRILALPITLIGTSMSNVFYKEASDQLKKNGNAKEVFITTVKKLSLLAVPMVIVVFIFSEFLFALIFGEEWRVAGEYARIIVPLIGIRLIVAPISVSLSVFEKQRISLLWQLGLLLLIFAIFGITYYYSLDIKTFLTITTIILSVYYFYFIFILYRVVCGKN